MLFNEIRCTIQKMLLLLVIVNHTIKLQLSYDNMEPRQFDSWTGLTIYSSMQLRDRNKQNYVRTTRMLLFIK